MFFLDRAFLTLGAVEVFEGLARRQGVSKVARSSEGFLGAFRRAGGKPAGLSRAWWQKRHGFIVRHEAQRELRNEPLWDAEGLPTRRHLALIMWAYSPASDEAVQKAIRVVRRGR